MKNEKILVCLTAENWSWPGSRVGECEECHDRIWISYSSPTDVIYLCSDCFGDRIKRGEEYRILPPSPEQMKQILEDRYGKESV